MGVLVPILGPHLVLAPSLIDLNTHHRPLPIEHTQENDTNESRVAIMDPNVEAAILCVGVLVSLTLVFTLVGILFGACPSCEGCGSLCRADPDEKNDLDREPWCCTLAIRWMCYKCCCCCGSGLRVREWLKEDLQRMAKSEKLIVE